tara:strand:- start:2482 stop:4269 length:1788 start_codon:yes stop_codon:yes gene_type:complete
MDDHKKKERSFRGVNGSLVQRILIIIFFLLVVPLLILSSFLYRDEVELKKQEIEWIFSSKVNDYQGIIEQSIIEKLKVLSTIDSLIEVEKDHNDILSKLSQKEGFSSLFHLNSRSGSYLCDHASEPELVGKDFSSIMGAAINGVRCIAKLPNLEFYVIDFNEKKKEAWVARISSQVFLSFFDRIEDQKGSAELILFDGNGTVFFSTLPNQEKIHRRVDQFGKIVDITLQGKNYLTLTEPVKRTNFSLMLSLPKTLQLVDIPSFLKGMLRLLTLIVLIGGGLTLFVTFRLSRPLKQLFIVMQKVGQGKVASRFKKDFFGFEINRLGQMFNDMIVSLIRHMEEVKTERVEKEKFEQELLIGQSVQNTIVPKNLPIFQTLDIGARFISAKEVGGDFYDFLEKHEGNEKELMISIADTSGKGVSACLYSLNIRSILRSFGKIKSKLESIIQETNNLFCKDTGDNGVFVTSWIGQYHEKTKKLSFSNCGHHPALLQKKDGQIHKLTTPGIALGVIHFEEVVVESVTLETGDLLLLFTDGVVEAHNSEMVMFGEKKLHRLLEAHKHLKAQAIVDHLIEELAIFAEGAPQYDDLTVVVIKVK